MSFNLVSAPAVEPLTVQEVKDHLRIVDDGNVVEDALLEGLITAVRHHMDGWEGVLRRQLITATWDFSLPEFPPIKTYIELPLAPVQSITSVSYIDANGATQIWDNSKYQLSDDLTSHPLLHLGYGESWPGTRDEPDSVTIRFVAGYGESGSDVPGPIRAAMLLLIGHLYNNRELSVTGTIITEIPYGVEALLSPYYRIGNI